MTTVTLKEWDRLIRHELTHGAADEYEALVALSQRGITPPTGSPEYALLTGRCGTRVPEETAEQDIRKAIQLLMAFEAEHPGVWVFSATLRAVQARLFLALFKMGRGV